MTQKLNIGIKRIYDEPSGSDGYRILVDRIWPRGVSKEEAELDEWRKELAPSEELRKWFDHKAERFDEFRDRYREELKDKGPALEEIGQKSQAQKVTLLYGARDRKHNQAVVLREAILALS